MILLCGGSVATSTLTVLPTFMLSVVLYTSLPVTPNPKFLPVKLTFPCLNLGYSPFWQYISELGVGPTAHIFNSGMIAVGFLGLPATPAIRKVLSGSVVVTLGSLLWLLGSSP